LITKEPIGVVAAVLPWNFPAQMYAWKVAPALVCGNSVIVKPSELTSLSAYRMTQLAHQAGIPEGALILVTGTGEAVGEPLGRHQDVDIVSFTGSTEVGRLFLKYSAESNLKEVVLECGGKSPQVVFEDALLDEAVPSILAAAFWNMSENCSCGSRLIVHSSLKDTLLQKLKQGLSSWKVGLPTDPDVSIGPMVEQAHFEKVASFLQNPGKNAKLVHGGRIHSDLGSGWYIEPTIFDHITPEDRLFQEEVFGPVLAITTFETEEQAIALANDTQYGLAASLYTLDVRRAQRVDKWLFRRRHHRALWRLQTVRFWRQGQGNGGLGSVPANQGHLVCEPVSHCLHSPGINKPGAAHHPPSRLLGIQAGGGSYH
jgi:gamma-glutamyl-gamma-aminobutyraldehyde dehydrogenase